MQSDIERIDSGIGRRPLHGVAATRRIEARAASTSPPFTLMARAGEAVARLALALAPHARNALVVAGVGNNGGDGFEAAATLAAWGRRVRVVVVGDMARLPADAAAACRRAEAAGVAIVPSSGRIDGSGDTGSGDAPDFVVDALLGIGTTRPPEGALATAITGIASLRAAGARVLSVDVPSGMDVDRGQPFSDACVCADDTITLLTLKPGLVTGSGRDLAGRLWLCALGISSDDDGTPPDAWLVGRADPVCAETPRRQATNKGSFGDVAVVGGSRGMVGAALLAARAAHAAGPGRVFVDLLGAADDIALDPLRPELMLRSGWSHGPVDVLSKATVVCGCGGGDDVRAVLPALLSTTPRLVLDADALNAIAADAALQQLLRARAARGLASILTPHPLEAARLLGIDVRAVQADRLDAARQLVARFRCVAVVKGSGTVIAAPEEAPRIGMTGNASLASAGTGDVLAGWIGGRWAAAQADACATATRAVIEHGAAAEPEHSGALRAADLVEALHARARAS